MLQIDAGLRNRGICCTVFVSNGSAKYSDGISISYDQGENVVWPRPRFLGFGALGSTPNLNGVETCAGLQGATITSWQAIGSMLHFPGSDANSDIIPRPPTAIDLAAPPSRSSLSAGMADWLHYGQRC